MNQVIVVKGQTLLDIAVQAAGSVEAAFGIAEANNISITDDLVEGMSLMIPEVIDQTIADYFRVHGIIPKTGIREQDRDAAPYSGIGYMAIGIDFIVK